MKRILFVDDEPLILKSITRVFIETDYDLLTARGGKEALNLLENNEVNLVISDMRMPCMDGYELLSKVKMLYPNIIRIILSGYSDEKIVLNALEKNIAKIYIFKPWDNDRLLEIINELFHTKNAL